MKLSGAAASRYFARPEPDRAGLLIFGADAMRVALKRAEAVKALVVPAAGEAPDPGAIIAWARDRIAHFKAPKSVDFIAVLPRNPSGKVLRRELRAPYWEGRSRSV